MVLRNKQIILGYICQYGNLHLDIIQKLTDKLFNNILPETDFKVVKDNKCYNQFGKAGAIQGRRTRTIEIIIKKKCMLTINLK